MPCFKAYVSIIEKRVIRFAFQRKAQSCLWFLRTKNSDLELCLVYSFNFENQSEAVGSGLGLGRVQKQFRNKKGDILFC